MSQLNVPVSLRVLRDSLARLSQVSWFDVTFKAGLLSFYTLIVYAAWTTGALFHIPHFAEDFHSRLGSLFLAFGGAYSSFMLVITAIRVVMAITYRPMPALADDELPTVTVIIPAYNEGSDVAKSIDSIARSNYPRGKMQIIAIDDGSKDDTWLHMDAAAKRHPDCVCAIRMAKNGGKRQGLRVGFALAAGDVLVTMDSDSVVERNALRSLVTPIARDPRIGSVAGNIKVLNRSAGILPRMMRASFVLAFDFTRAYQSKIGAVLCTPGAFSAYRRTAVEAVLNDWNNQSWRGKPATIAEDRALSNLILREGHEISFQSDAVVWTNVPTTYKQMARMYQRWERGNLRENITYGKFCWKPFRNRFRHLANLEWVLGCADMICPYILIAVSLAYSLINPFFLLQYLAYIVIFASLMQIYFWMRERNSDCIYGVLYSLFWFTSFWWVVPYSILTASNGSWMTRTLPAGTSKPAELSSPAILPADRIAA
ncbi:MAG: glycosyltransferase [Phycisphaerales bacterium]|nr:glycosyltransferase [Phycisphaerales bacterium]